MRISIFILAFLSSIGSYVVISAWLDQRTRTAALRRFRGKETGQAAAAQTGQPVLIQLTDAVRGRFATRILDRLRLKPTAEGWLETASRKWGAAGLLHRSVGAFLAAFALVTIPTRNHMTVLALIAGGAGAWGPLLYV